MDACKCFMREIMADLFQKDHRGRLCTIFGLVILDSQKYSKHKFSKKNVLEAC